eukprot:COSAG05_NODE_177_length_14916_cov_8.104002_17_plen_152_part_00
MLKLYAERAGVATDKKLRILDMGCGWGSVSLWFAEHFPDATVRGISNSNSQREWIMAKAKKRGLGNLKIYTGNIVEWNPPKEEEQFDVVISIESASSSSGCCSLAPYPHPRHHHRRTRGDRCRPHTPAILHDSLWLPLRLRLLCMLVLPWL